MDAEVGKEAAHEKGYDTWLNELRIELEELAANDSQPYSSVFAEATLATMDEPEEDEMLSALYHSNRERTAPDALRMLRASRAFALVEVPGVAYPYEYTTAKDWLDGFSIMRDMPFRDIFSYCLTRRDLGTSISQRYVAAKFLDKVLEHRIGLFPTRADVGCGNNAGNRHVILSDWDERFRFDTVSIMTGRSLGSLTLSEEKTDIFNLLAGGRVATRRIVGIDKEDPHDPLNIHWRRSCLTPEEHVNGRIPRLNDALMYAEISEDRLGFRQADVTKVNDIKSVLRAEGGQFDVVSSVASYYQGTARQRRAKIRNIVDHGSSLLKPRGLAYFIDFVRRANGSLMPLRKWTEMNVFIWMDGEFTRVMAATSGRWNSARIFKGLTKFTDGGPYEQEVRELVA